MIVAAAVCPGAPFLVPGVADAIGRRLQPVARACGVALGRLPALDDLVLVTAGAAAADGHRLLPPGSVIPTTSFRRGDLPGFAPIVLPGGPDTPRSAPTVNPAVGTIVGASLVAGASIGVPVSALEISGDPAASVGVVLALTGTARRTGLLVIADGSACHGDDAPGKRDDRAAGFDAALAGALAAGDPVALLSACADRELAAQLLSTVDPLALLALLTARRPPAVADLQYAGAPLGVGYLVASWLWDGP